jgi:glutathione S-transferase
VKLYWGSQTCAIGIHILLEEIGEPYETEQLDVDGGATHRPPYLAINPKGKVPTLLRDDGSVLTEFGAIAQWLARVNPQAGLMPEDAEAQARVFETIEYVEGSIHGQGYGRLFKPQLFEPQDLMHGALGIGQAAVRQQGRRMVTTGFAILDAQLARNSYAVGDSFTIADAALFYVERWAPAQGIDLPVNVEAHFKRMLVRPAVETVMRIWKEDVPIGEVQ